MKKLLMLAMLALGVLALRGGGGPIYINYQPGSCKVSWLKVKTTTLSFLPRGVSQHSEKTFGFATGSLGNRYVLFLSEFSGKCPKESPCIFAPAGSSCELKDFVLKTADGTFYKQVEKTNRW